MPTPRPLRVAATGLVALAALLSVAGCTTPEESEEARREGLALPLEGITYNVFITRQLNLRDVEDMGYVRDLEAAPAGASYYGVFLEACNISDEPKRTTSDFRIVDSAGNEFEPLELPEENPFSYASTVLEPNECLPPAGSLASAAPTSGALMMFEIPLEATENRPLELEILDGFDFGESHPHELLIELDL